MWRARLPDATGPDAYVSLELDRGRIAANSRSAYRVVLDLESGAIIEKEFTK